MLPVERMPTGAAFIDSLLAFRGSNLGRWGERIGVVDGQLKFLFVHNRSAVGCGLAGFC